MKKKIITVLLAACVTTAAAGCGNSNKNTAATEASDVSTEQENGSAGAEAAEKITYNVDDYVTLGKYKGLDVVVEGDFDVTDEKVKDEINQSCANYPNYKTLDKKTVENGDVVDIDYVGKRDGKAFDGGSAEGYKLEIGSNTFIDGFESGLIGAEVGKTVSLNLTFPEKYQNEELAGKAVVFDVTVNGIVQKEDVNYDTLTDDYVLQNFQKNNVQEYVDSVRSDLETQAKNQKESQTKSAVLNKVVENAKIRKLPDGLLEQRKAEYDKKFEKQCKSYGVEKEDYLKQQYNMTLEQYDSMVEQSLIDNLQTELVFEAIAKKEGYEIDQKGFDEFVQKTMSQMGITDKETLYETYGEDYIKNVYLDEIALDNIMKEAKITYKKPSTEENVSGNAEATASDAAEAAGTSQAK